MKSELSTPSDTSKVEAADSSAERWSGPGWTLALASALALLAGAVGPPVVGAEARAVLVAAFDGFCHQLPERSFSVGGVPFAVCHRCTGILVGLALGVLLLPALRTQRGVLSERAWLLAAVFPLALDWSGDLLGLWSNLGARIATGLWFGLVVGVVFARALAVRGERAVGERLAADSCISAAGPP